jgi:hypothetical protein
VGQHGEPGTGARGRDKPALRLNYPRDTENFEMPTKCRRSRLFAGPQAGKGRGYPALSLTPTQRSRLESGYKSTMSNIHKINSPFVYDSDHMLLDVHITC